MAELIFACASKCNHPVYTKEKLQRLYNISVFLRSNKKIAKSTSMLGRIASVLRIDNLVEKTRKIRIQLYDSME